MIILIFRFQIVTFSSVLFNLCHGESSVRSLVLITTIKPQICVKSPNGVYILCVHPVASSCKAQGSAAI